MCPLEDTTNLVMEDFPRAMYSSASVSEEAFDDPWENPCTNILIVDDSSTNRSFLLNYEVALFKNEFSQKGK